MKTLVLGLGNPLLTDDGVGIRVAEVVEAHLPSEATVDVTQVSVGGLRLMEAMLGYDRVILVDALCSQAGKPGTIQRMTLADLQTLTPTEHSTNAHDTTLSVAWNLGRRLGLSLPREVIIYAIHVQNVTDFGEELTPSVAQAVPKVAARILAELRLHTA